MENKIRNYFNFFEEQNFICFSMQAPIITKMHNGKESKEIKMPTNWQNFDDNSHFCFSDNTFYIQTGERSNITVLDFDDKEVYEKLISKCPDLKNIYTVSTNKGYHLYFRYNHMLKTKTNVYTSVDIRNNSGCIIAPPT